MHLMKLNPSPFERIKNGSKKVEIRLFDEKRQKLKVNELIQFSNLENPEERIIVEILNLTRFSTFHELLLNTPMEKFGYSQSHNIQKFLESIYTIYTKTQEETYGVLAIEVELKG
jgi:ASC-1-like (ASCH) protein